MWEILLVEFKEPRLDKKQNELRPGPSSKSYATRLTNDEKLVRVRPPDRWQRYAPLQRLKVCHCVLRDHFVP